MKVSLPGLGGIKMLALRHGEKVVIGIVAACVGYMVLQSLGRESLPDNREASDLQQEISQANGEISQVTWEDFVKEHPEEVRLAKPLDQRAANVDGSKYLGEHSDIGMNPPIVPPIVRRGDPVLLAVADVEASGGSGLLAFTNDQIRQEAQLALQRKAAEQAAAQVKQQAQNPNQEEGRNPRGRGGRGAEDGNGPIDPEHPNRRPANASLGGSVGVQQAGDEEVRVGYWAVVVAKVPIKEQLKLYEDALSRALGYSPQTDTPRYLGYLVERAEVRPGVEDKDLKWQKVIVSNGKGLAVGKPGLVTAKGIYGTGQNAPTNPTAKLPPSVITDWAAMTPELVDPRYLDPSGMLAFPLPPLVGRSWGREVTHADVPFIEDAVEIAAETPGTPEGADAAANAEDEDEFGGAGSAMGGGAGNFAGDMGRGGGGRFGGGGEFGGRGPMGMGMGGRGEFGGRGEGGAGMYAGGGGMGAEGRPVVPHWLLRFFDFSVQPGKKYKYRVRLALLDPNQTFGQHFVSVDWLDREATDRVRAERAKLNGQSPKTPVRLTEWSEPSRTVSIPLAGSVYVASAKPPIEQSFTDEPRTSLLVASFSADESGKPIEGGKKFDDFRRGFVANRKAEAEALIVDDDGRQMIDKIKDFPLRTGVTVVDIRGGDRLAGRDNLRPARVLLMDPAGQLFVRSELNDADAVKMHEQVFTEDPDAMRGMGGRGGMGEFGGEFGGRGGPMPGR